MKRIYNLLFLLFLTLFASNAFAQIVGTECFLQGTYTEVGIGACGIFKTNNAAPAAGPLGAYHGNVPGLFGFVCDAGKNGWATAGGTVTILDCGESATLPNYCGDYFVPGTPEEGFVVRANGTNYVNNGTTGCPGAIAGGVTSYTFTAADAIGVWTGNITVPGGTLTIVATTTVPRNQTYFITNVSITNSSPNPVTGVYYMRTLDPDNDQPTTGSYSTRNRVRYVPILPPTIQPDHCYALVEAQGGCGGTGNRGCYLGLGAKDSRARAAYGGFTNTDPVAVWNGTGGMTSTLGSVQEGDIGVSISFNLGDIAAGGSTNMAFAYALSVADLTAALDATATTSSLTANGADISFSGSASACNNSPLELTVSSGGSYTWTWSPCTYLSACTGATVFATVPSGSMTYTVTGTSPCNPTLSRTITVTATTPPAPPTSPGATIYCGQQATATATPNAGGTIDWYSALTGGTKLADNSLNYTTPILTASQTYYIDEYVYAPGSGNGILPYDETFECVSVAETYDVGGNAVGSTLLNNNGSCVNDKNPSEWFFNDATGRARARFLATGVTASPTGGGRVLTMDSNNSSSQTGELTLTLNLAGYSTASDLTLGFEYLRHGSGTLTVKVRRNNAATWATIGTYNAGAGWLNVSGLDIDAVVGGPVTSTFQVMFNVVSSNTATTNAATSGFSIDNIKIRGTENTPPSFCLSTPRTPVNVIVNPLPMPSATNAFICAGGSTTLTATKNSGIALNILQWYSAAVAGTLLQTGASYTTPVLTPGTYTYYVQEATPPGIDVTYNFAANADGWTTSQDCATTAGTWTWASDGGVGAMASANVNSGSQSLVSPVISCAGIATVNFSYNHRVSLESGFDNGIVLYRLNNGAWGAWQKFTPTTGTYNANDNVNTDPYFGAPSCSASGLVDCYTGTLAYSTHSGTINTTGMTSIQVAFFTSSDGSVTSGGWFVNWARINSTTGGSLCTSPRRAVTVTVGTPANDNICNAQVANLGDNIYYSNACATVETNEPSPACFADGPAADPLARVTRTIWFRFTPALSRNYLFYIKEGNPSNTPSITATGTQFDSEMALYTVSSGTVCTNTFSTGLSLAMLKCNDDRAATGWYAPQPLYSEFTQFLSTGQTVYVQVDGSAYSNTVAGGVKREEALLATSTSNNINLFIDIILPIDLVSFNGKKEDKVNVLNWEVARNFDVENFEIMRSVDGTNFVSIGKVAATSDNKYSFVDENPITRAYYRLRITEKDGTNSVTEAVYITRGQSSFSVVELKPNPTKDRFELSFEIEKDQMVNIDLLDCTGKVLRSDEYKAKIGINNINFDLSNYVKGLYTVRIISEGESIVRKVVKD